MITCPYGQCDGSGLIPFVKDGKVVPNAWMDCYCKSETEYYHPIRPEDYDFACSNSFRAWTYEYCGVPDPGNIPYQPDTEKVEQRINNLEAISAEPGQIPRQYHDQLRQLKGQVLYLQKKIEEMSEQKKKITYKKQVFKDGIEI